MNELGPYMAIPTLADAQHFGFAAGRVLSRRQTEPCGQITPFGKGAGIAHCSDQRRGINHTDAGNCNQAPRQIVLASSVRAAPDLVAQLTLC